MNVRRCEEVPGSHAAGDDGGHRLEHRRQEACRCESEQAPQPQAFGSLGIEGSECIWVMGPRCNVHTSVNVESGLEAGVRIVAARWLLARGDLARTGRRIVQGFDVTRDCIAVLDEEIDLLRHPLPLMNQKLPKFRVGVRDDNLLRLI